MKWVLIALLLFGNILFSIYSVMPLLVTLPQQNTHDISYNVGDNTSIRKAIRQASNEGMIFGRDYFGSGTYLLLGLVLVNFIILVFVVAERNVKDNENDS